MRTLCVLALIGTAALVGAAPASGTARASEAPGSLSAQQIEDLRAGRGMGLAMAAERNSFPGPAHVLELDEALALSPEQRTETRALFARMREEAVAAGARLMAAESALDALFASGAVDEPRLRAAVDRLNASRADLQFIHLRTHIAMRALLTPAQVARYDELRGHRAEIPAPAHRH